MRDRQVTDPARTGHSWPSWTASVVGVGRGLWLFPLDVTFKTVGLRYGWLKALFERTPAWILAGLGQLRAERAAWRAVRNVPAYRRFLQDAGVRGRSLYPLGILARLPETDKRSYVDRFGFLERCVDGSVPYPGTTIDESSGSTGTPYNWIRGHREREVAHRNIGFFARYAFGNRPLVTINAFSMGAWAAGFNMSLGMMRHGIVKSVGPDLDKILSTLDYLGPGYRFLISGYPPFLKHLLDEGDRRGFPWARYQLHALVGGEGMSPRAARCPPHRETVPLPPSGSTQSSLEQKPGGVEALRRDGGRAACATLNPCYTEREMANLTVTVDERVLRRARIRALERGTSVNAVVAEYLERYAGADATAAALAGFLDLAAHSHAGAARAAGNGGETSCMTERTFVDTNVWVYALDDDEPAKQACARRVPSFPGPKRTS